LAIEWPIWQPWAMVFVENKAVNNTIINSGIWVVLAIFAKKTAVFSCLTNALAPPPIALESCSAAQTDRPV